MNRLFCMSMLATALFAATLVVAESPASQPAKDSKAAVSLNDPKAYQGYTLFSPLSSNKTYLLDMQGRIVRVWEGAAPPELSAVILPNGNLLRPCGKAQGGNPGTGERIQEFTFDGELVWDYKFPDKYFPHHDITKLPNGNVLAVVYEKKTVQESTAVGRKDNTALEVDSIIEIRPNGKNGGDVIWQWSVWDHLIQDADNKQAHFGKIGDYPQLIDVNLGGAIANLVGQPGDKGKAKGGIGALAGLGGGGVPGGSWTHINGIDYNAELDQIIISVHGYSEFWIIDHGTTTAEAASHKGGKQGKGGDLLYRWGNPQNYHAGKAEDQRLFSQHNAHWIPRGLPGAGNVLVFNNGLNRPGGSYSSADEIALPVDAKGSYSRKAGTAFGPEKAVWSYSAPKKSDFYSQFISGVQRLPNGNTLICSGQSGTIFEVTPKDDMVWKYTNPVKGPALSDILAKGIGDLLKKGNKKDGNQLPAIAGLGNLIAGQWVFRAYRYGPDYPGLAGRKLTPGLTVEETLPKEKSK